MIIFRTALISLSLAMLLSAPPARCADAPPFTISRLVVGTGIENRVPYGIADTFPASTVTVWGFLEAGGIASDTTATFVWIHDGKEMLATTLPVRAGARWRTAASKNLMGLAGQWRLELRDASGAPIQSVAFTVR